VCGIGGYEKATAASVGRSDSEGCRDRRLAYTALAADENEPVSEKVAQRRR